MIVRVIAVDPRPQPGEQDLRVFQVPENSREHELLKELFEAAGIEHETLGPPIGLKRKKKEAK